MRTIDEAEVDPLLSRLVEGQLEVLGGDLVGSYLFGSAATGTFEPGSSDVDTVGVLRSDLTAPQISALEALHRAIVREMPAWDDRVEAVYLSAEALLMFRTRPSTAARISPGEPFHTIVVDHRWLIDWYQLRSVGIALLGRPATDVVPPISPEEYVAAVRQHLLAPDWLDGLVSDGGRSYAILSMCRGLRTCETGEHVSKRDGARWASELMPGHARLIADALVWRARSRSQLGEATMTEETARSFVMDVQRRLR